MQAHALRYRRVLLKLSGEALMGECDYGIDPQVLHRLATEILNLQSMGVEIGLVIGGGNIFRGAGLAEGGMDRVTGDHMGMLATVMNALAMQDAIERQGGEVRVMSGLSIHQVCEDYVRRRAVRHLEKKRVVIFAAGTGSPYFTTDTAGSLRAIESCCDVLIKATKVDGVYDCDPMKNPHACRFDTLTYDEAINRQLGVMDATALVMCRDNNLPLIVADINLPGLLQSLVMGERVGTLVTREIQ